MTITVTLPDGSTHEVEPSALALPEGAQFLAPGASPEGYVPKEFHEAEVKRRAKDTASIRRELEADEEFRAGILKNFGIKLGEDGNPVIPDVSSAVQTARQKWEAEQLEPVTQSLTALQTNLARQALQAAAKGLVRDEFASAPVPGAPSYVETVLGSRVRFDPELGYVVALAEDGKTPLPSSSPKPGRPYADAAEFVNAFVASDAGAMLRKETQKQHGANYRGSVGGGDTKSMSRANFDSLSPTDRAAHIKAGGSVTD